VTNRDKTERYSFLCVGKSAAAVLLTVILCIPVQGQQSNCYTVWELSGASGDSQVGPQGNPAWQSTLSQLLTTQGGPITSCKFTFNLVNPQTGYGTYYGDCIGPRRCPDTPPIETAQGHSCPYCGKPISLASGNTYIEQSDIRLPGLGKGLSLTRIWNSIWPSTLSESRVGLFGPNWRSTYEERVSIGANDGNRLRFSPG
jgi:uncharacterized protein DUF6531